MSLSIFGITFHEFDIGFSDLILAIISLYFLVRLRKYGITSFILFLGIFLSSLFGACFHFFFPEKVSTFGGVVVWSLVAISIGITQIGIGNYLAQELRVQKYKWIIFLYVGVYFAYFFSGNYSYGGIIVFYAPWIILLGMYASYKTFYKKYLRYLYLFLGVVISLLAAAVQMLHIEIPSLSITYNTLYHIIQGVGFYCLYRFFLTHEKLP